jgi:RND family efflux transporter MFP subunit
MYKALSIIISLLFLSACDSKPKEAVKVKEELITLNTHTIKKQTYPIWVDFSGKTQAVDEVIVTSRVSGELKNILFRAGSSVKRDEILFEIDKSEYQSIWEQQNAILQKDRASLNLANANVTRYRPLVKEQLAPKEKLDELIATKKQLEATIKADKASLHNAKLNLDYCDIKATIDGQIGKELLMIGNIVNIGTNLAKIVQTKSLYVNFHPSAYEVSLIKKYKSTKNPKVKAILQSGNGNGADIGVEGEIDFVDTVSNTSTGTVAMRAKIDNKDELLLAGTFVKLKLFVTDKLSLIALHPNQISQSQQGEYVWVVDSNDTLEKREIKVSYSNNDLVIIKKGLKEGDRVVVGTVSGLSSGIKVVTKDVANPIEK